MAFVKVKSFFRRTKRGRRVKVRGYTRGQSWKQRSKRARRNDLSRKAKYRPAKVWRPGRSHLGDY